MQRRFGWVAAAVSLVVLGACVISDPVGQEALTQATVPTPPGGPCPEEVCGSNSPVIDSLGFHELSLFGVPNLEGFSIWAPKGLAQIIQGSQSYDLHVVKGVITGTRTGLVTLAGTALRDAWILIQRGTSQYALVIRDARLMTFFAPPFDRLEAYTLEWLGSSQERSLPLCDNIAGLIEVISKDPEQGREELLGMTVLESIVFEGDRIDSKLKTMSKIADDKWFNVGCAGETLAKLHLTRNTIHSQVPGMFRAWEQRQATMKMYVADYCNTGESFTVQGQKLVWQGGGLSYLHPPWLLEARWTEAGAQCLYAPRMLFPTTSFGATQFPDIMTEIAAVCSPPRCKDVDPFDYAGADRVSSTP